MIGHSLEHPHHQDIGPARWTAGRATRSALRAGVELAWTLVRPDFKARYHGSLNGFAWALLRPACMFVVLMTVFSFLFPAPGYKLNLIIGLCLWEFVSDATKTGLIARDAKAFLIYLKLRQEGRRVNHQRVDRRYAEARLQVRRRRRKKIPLADRQPLARPRAPNEVWSADFVFDRTAEGRVLKCLTIVNDATTEAVAVVPARALGASP